MKLPSRFVAQTLALAFFLATLGFCYSIVTQADAGSLATGVEPRSVGSSPLRFLSPAYAPIPADYDLGDALYGTIITRYITATGGLRPYNFSSNVGGVVGATSTLAVQTAGCVMGSASFSTPRAALAFTVSVTGSTESDITADPVPLTVKTFHLQLFATGANLFRFANDHLNTGVLGQAYISKADSIGGKGTVTYSIVAGSVNLNGAQLGTGNSLEDSMGLSFSSDGTLYGRPLKTGLVSFTARATDSIKRFAKDRTNAVQDQILTFNVEDTRITATDSTIMAVSVKGDTSKLNTDTLKFQAFMNLSGTNTTGLANQTFTFMFGGNAYNGFMNQSGVVGTQLGAPLVFPDGTTLTATVDSVNGTVKGMLKHANLSAALNAANIVNRGTKRVAVSIQICSLINAADTIDLVSKHVGTKYALDYKIGKLGQPLGGGFQLYDVRGSDLSDIAGNPGDAWTAKFLILPRLGIDANAAFTGVNSVSVRIGTKFSQTVPASGLKIGNNGSINLASKGLGASLNKLQINSRSFSGMIMTNPLSNGTTGLPQAVDTVFAKTNFFNLAIDVNRNAPDVSFNGEDAKFIFKVPTFKKWVDRNTKKPKP